MIEWFMVNGGDIQMSKELRKVLVSMLTQNTNMRVVKSEEKKIEFPIKRKRHKRGCRIRVVDKETEKVKFYTSCLEAAKALNVSDAMISVASRTPSFGFISKGKLAGKIITKA